MLLLSLFQSGMPPQAVELHLCSSAVVRDYQRQLLAFFSLSLSDLQPASLYGHGLCVPANCIDKLLLR